VSFDPDIVNMRTRVVKARAARDAGQASGNIWKYVSACSDLQALEAELDRLREQRIRSTASCRR
jgi:hypothetical protein